MTDELKNKIGQMFAIGIPASGMRGDFLDLCNKYKMGNFWLSASNIITPEQICRDVSEIRKITYDMTGIYPLIGIDQEGGWVARLYEGAASISGPMSYAAAGIGANGLRQVGKKLGRILRSIGCNINSAPDLDVNVDPDNPIICSRSFGDDPEKVSELGLAIAEGFESEGVIACVKHFPGHGNVSSDTHLEMATNRCDKETLKNTEFLPFQRAFLAKVGALMTAHVTYEKISPLPATLSYEIMTELLRHEMGFEGIAITDSIYMKAIARAYPNGEGSVRAIEAGCDVILVYSPYRNKIIESVEAVYKAVESGRISRERIEESYERIMKAKARYDVEHSEPNAELANKLIYDEENIRENFEHKLRSITCLKDDGILSSLENKKMLCIAPTCDAIRGVEEARREVLSFADSFAEAFKSSEPYVCSMSGEMTDELKAKLKGDFDAIVIGLTNSEAFPAQFDLVREARKSGKPVIIVLLKSPYTYRQLKDSNAVIAIYEYTTLSVNAAIEAMKSNNYRGKLPVKIEK